MRILPLGRGKTEAGISVILLVAFTTIGCFAPGASGQNGDREDVSATPARFELCVQNNARLPATVQLFRDGAPVGSPVHVTGFARACRSMHRGEMLGTLDAGVEPDGSPDRHFPEPLRDILVTTESTGVEVTLTREGVQLYSQSTYRLRSR